MFLRKIIILCIAILSFAVPASAEGFGSFGKDDLNPRGGAKRMADPTGSAPVSKANVFTIAAGYCNPQRYDPSTPDSDCYYNSTRAQDGTAAPHATVRRLVWLVDVFTR